MPLVGASATPESGSIDADTVRMARDDRRQALLDSAAEIVAGDGVEEVSMETVADRAGVSRALVYKHFANRTEILTALFRREALQLHKEIAGRVKRATTVDEMYRALVRASFDVSADRSALFAALRGAGALSRQLRTEQRARDAQTVKLFAALTAEEYDLPLATARRATAMLLTAFDSILAQWRPRRSAEHARLLEQTYLDLVNGGLRRLAETSRLE